MPWKNTDTRYSTMSIALHWLMLVLLALVYACIEFRGMFPKGSGGRALITDAHYMLGLSVFVLVWLRLLARALGVAPKILPTPPNWQMIISKLMHWALYLFMIGTPLLGWATLSAGGHSVPFFGLDLPALVSEDKGLARQLKNWHGLAGSLGYWLIGLHAVAGLYHHYVVRDNTLLRIIPKRG